MASEISRSFDYDFDDPLGLLADCHRRVEYFLDELVRITRMTSGRSLNPEEWSQLHRALHYFETYEPWHTADEEESLFPRLHDSQGPEAARVGQLLTQLERVREMIQIHRRMISVFCRRWLDHGFLSEIDTRSLLDRLTDLESIYREHITIEDHELFPAAARLLSTGQLEEIGREMAARRSVSG
ncbi:MAG TPA: hemerythrin domain-containing protein [Vicinamibacterales bacterium]|nr:hemerythrin domain-containing protein [Vicinamibacterales bacterium]